MQDTTEVCAQMEEVVRDQLPRLKEERCRVSLQGEVTIEQRLHCVKVLEEQKPKHINDDIDSQQRPNGRRLHSIPCIELIHRC